ncbi:unnamed protein product [Prorocentrum cordatum]|uniref:Uncharacterized protein n=1 Tax=Prorocentrum cordatum TaxID=2364126 RepID=A0ABN9PHA0_9DINO|nr:unnamed protein product [Polarella glacialis]
MVAAGKKHSVLLRSDGVAVAVGARSWGQCDIPALDEGLTYTQIAAGGTHTLLLRSDGAAVACGRNDAGQCSIPAPGGAVTYAQVAAGDFHTALLKSDGTAVAFGQNQAAQCCITSLESGLTYTEVAAGGCHTVLLRSDGVAVAHGANFYGQCQVPSCRTWAEWLQASPAHLQYVQSLPPWALPALVLQASFDGVSVLFTTLGGKEFLKISATPADRLADVHARLMTCTCLGMLRSSFSKVEAVLPGGELLSHGSTQESTSVAETFPTVPDHADCREAEKIRCPAASVSDASATPTSPLYAPAADVFSCSRSLHGARIGFRTTLR